MGRGRRLGWEGLTGAKASHCACGAWHFLTAGNSAAVPPAQAVVGEQAGKGQVGLEMG